MNTLVENCEIEHQIDNIKLSFSKKYVDCDKYIGKAIQTTEGADKGFRVISMVGAFYCSEEDIAKSVYTFEGEYKFERDGKQYTFNGKTQKTILHLGTLSRDDVPNITFTGCFIMVRPAYGKLKLFEHEMYIKKYNGKSYTELFDDVEKTMENSELIYLGPELFTLLDNKSLHSFSTHYFKGISKIDKNGNITMETGQIIRISDDNIELTADKLSKNMSAKLQKIFTV